MAIQYQITKHAVAYTSKLLAKYGGKHIFNVLLTNACDNGNLIALGDWKEFDVYAEGAVTTFAGVIREQAANGNWYVEVTTPGDALLICQVPMIYEDFTADFKKEGNFYNPAGAIVRAYELAAHDIFEVSAEAFDGTPEAGKTVSCATRKLKVATDDGEG